MAGVKILSGPRSRPVSCIEVGLTTLGQPRLSEGAQPYPRQRLSAQRETGDRIVRWGHFFQVPGLGRRVSGSGLCHLSFIIDSAILHFRCQVTATGASAIQASAVSLRQPAPGASCHHLRFPNRLPLTADTGDSLSIQPSTLPALPPLLSPIFHRGASHLPLE